jgi:hypothetical protein
VRIEQWWDDDQQPTNAGHVVGVGNVAGLDADSDHGTEIRGRRILIDPRWRAGSLVEVAAWSHRIP